MMKLIASPFWEWQNTDAHPASFGGPSLSLTDIKSAVLPEALDICISLSYRR